jgi:hypothetical protein
MYQMIPNLEFRDVGTETLVYDPSHERVHVLNVTAAEILRNCSGKSVGELAMYLRDHFDADGYQVESDIRKILDAFLGQGLVRETPV